MMATWMTEKEATRERVLALGVCCAEAQADGVPCADPWRNCLRCGRALPARRLALRLTEATRTREGGG
ncbi:MAG TPA: hypothetical protein VMM12_14370 [Longimicrobiales bacterium]|nr:hypothetical protein [Longimicrobiales bacterium]